MPRRVLKATVGLAAVSLVATACGAPPGAGDPGPGGTSPPPEEAVARIDGRCGEVAEAIAVAEPGAAAEPLREIGESLPAREEELRAEMDRVAASLAEERGDELTEDHLTETLPALIELADRLVGLGATTCASVQETAGAHLPPALSDPEEVRAAATEHREVWRSQGIDTYHFDLSVHMEGGRETEPPCGVSGWLFVQVTDGRPELAVDRFSGCRVDPQEAERRGSPLTVEAIFDLVVARADAPLVEVDYHPSLGYPRSVFVQADEGIIELSVQDFGMGRADLSGPQAVLDALEEARRRWEAQGIDDYVMTVEVGCFCPPEIRGPFQVTVADGEIARATFEGEPIEERVDRRYLTVEGLFRVVERHAYADAIEVTYHLELGYPEVIDVDPLRNAIDEELVVAVPEFTVP